MKKVDYIIVGQGLAGSAVAVQLLRTGRRILVIDQPDRNNSSRIAAGLFNPVTGRKMVKTWLADTLFPYLHTFYRDVERRTATEFLHSVELYRPFVSIEEQNEWMAKSDDPAFRSFVGRVETSPWLDGIRDEFGGLRLRACGYLDTKQFIRAVASWIEQDGELLAGKFDFGRLQLEERVIRYDGYEAEKLIFCTGVHENPLFRWLPVRSLKGETLSVTADFDCNLIVNRGVYLLKLPEGGTWRVGSTYNFTDTAPGVTGEGRAELERKLSQLTDFPYTVVDQQWGLRPTTPDRRPILGAHPRNNRVFVFNGLGTKGVSLAPYFSEVLIRSIENEGALNKEVDIERYKSLYWNSPE
ncbi:MAG TPA: FAD-binding oxidoreductase [Ohtaekwangia sp.]|nr:FAD-binding oxidoreductase [Ohtaekwangia sp.]